MNRRVKTGLGIGALALLLATGGHFMNASGMTAFMLNKGADFPGLPGTKAASGALFLQALLALWPVGVLTGFAAMLRRGLACLVYLISWFWGLSRLSTLFLPPGASSDLWLLWTPGITPAIGFVGAVVIFVVMDPARR